MSETKIQDAEVVNESQALTVRHSQEVGRALGVEEIIAQVTLIQKVMQAVMKDGEHYGTIPGCGDKKTLLQPGAQKLTMTFRLCPEYEIQEVNIERGHKEYRVICTLKSMGNGAFVGQGVGCCSTMESKYRWRGGTRKCPKCGKETIIMGKQFKPTDPPPGWLCWTKKGGCGATWPKGSAEIEHQSMEKQENENPADCYNCVTAETRLLTHDLRWVAAGDIENGDMLIGVQEQMSDQYSRNLAVGEAIVYGTKEDVVYEVALDDGRRVRCNGEHQWLVKKVGLKGTEWVSTQDIHREISERDGRPRHWCVMSLCLPWDEDVSKEAGYIAGLLDGDGSLSTDQAKVLFAQQDNIVLGRMETGLGARGYLTGKSMCKTVADLARCKSQEQVYSLRILGGLAEQMRLLGSIRPPRLLERWLTRIDLSQRRLEGKGSGAGRPTQIVGITITGTEEIVLLGSSCGTYIAEGLVAHNTVLKMAKKRAFVDATITATAASDIFTQDIGDDEGDAPEVPPPAQRPAPRAAAPPASAPPPARPAAPALSPTVAPAPAASKAATASHRAKMIENLKAGVGQPNRPIVTEYFEKIDQLIPGESLESLELRFVPSTAEQMNALADKLAGFGNGEQAARAFVPGEIEAAPASAPTPEPGLPPPPLKMPKDDEAWREVVVVVPRKGQKRDEYLKNPDTIGSLFDMRHGSDDESAAARTRLWGFVTHYEPKGWEKNDGTKMPPNKADIEFREALDAFADWFEKQHPGEKL